mmetsp:Transcript_11619/g.30262  ORF Transcript_11619/g.30262 Transcript_11619/m.30262 type:complete len:571 (+) Transcript_11619:43-1755(+)
MAHVLRRMKRADQITRVRACLQSDMSLLCDSFCSELTESDLPQPYMDNLRELGIDLLDQTSKAIRSGVEIMLESAEEAPIDWNKVDDAKKAVQPAFDRMRAILQKIRDEFTELKDEIQARGTLPTENPLVRHFLLRAGWDVYSVWLSSIQDALPYEDFDGHDGDGVLPVCALVGEVQHLREELQKASFEPDQLREPVRVLGDTRQLSCRAQDTIRALLDHNRDRVASDIEGACACARDYAVHPTRHLHDAGWSKLLDAALASAEMYRTRASCVEPFDEVELFDESHVEEIVRRADILEAAHAACARELAGLVDKLQGADAELGNVVKPHVRKRLDFDGSPANKRMRVDAELRTQAPSMVDTRLALANADEENSARGPSAQLSDNAVTPRGILGSLRASIHSLVRAFASPTHEHDYNLPSRESALLNADTPARDQVLVEVLSASGDGVGALGPAPEAPSDLVTAWIAPDAVLDDLTVVVHNSGPTDMLVLQCTCSRELDEPELLDKHLAVWAQLERLRTHVFGALEITERACDADRMQPARVHADETKEFVIPWPRDVQARITLTLATGGC